MMSASMGTMLELWVSSLRDVKARIRPLFTQERVAASVCLFLDGLLGPERRKTGWMRASCRIRLAGLRRSITQTSFRCFGAFAAVMLLAGLVLQEHAIGQTEPPHPAFAEMACDDLPGLAPEIRPLHLTLGNKH